MNQTTNLIQWKNLTQEQKDAFDFENYKYEYQREYTKEWVLVSECPIHRDLPICGGSVYRLMIEPEKWYTGFINGELVTCLGSCFDGLNPEILRPARPDEIPTPEKALEQKIQEKWPDKEVVMLKWCGDSLCIYDSQLKPFSHITAQSMRGFHTYVYQRPQDDSFFPDTKAIYCWNEFLTLQPVAVLFERSEG